MDVSSPKINWSSDSSMVLCAKGVLLSEASKKKLSSYPGLFWFATSGSLQRKWIGLSKEGFRASAKSVNSHLGVTSNDVWARGLPIEHVGGFSIYVRALESGCRVVELYGKWDPKNFFEHLHKDSCTIVSLVPTQLYDLVSQNLSSPKSLRVALVGGASLEEGLRQRALALGWPVVVTYGCTEASSQIACQSVETIYDASVRLNVLSHIHVRLDTNGVLEIAGPSVAHCVATQDSDGTLNVFDPRNDGWYTTSDCVVLTKDGGDTYLQMLGRLDRQVKILGELVSLDALEQEMLMVARCVDPLVSTIVVVPISDKRRGVALHLVVEGETILTVDIVNAKVSGLKKINAVHVLSSFPRLDNQKVDRKAIADKIASLGY